MNNLHNNWKTILPVLITDLVDLYWQSEEGTEKYKVSPEIKNQIKHMLKTIVANVGRKEVKDICFDDGVYLNNAWFDTLEKS